jgi:predicted permease
MQSWDAEIRERLRPLRMTRKREAEIVEELSQHLDDRFAELCGCGMAPDEARRITLAELSGSDSFRHMVSAADLDPEVESPAPGAATAGSGLAAAWRDLRFGARSLRKTPAFTALTIGTLALAIGATVTMFTLVNAVILRPLPFPEGERLVRFWGTAPEKGLPVVDFPDAIYHYLRTRARTLTFVSGASNVSFTLTGDGEPERLQAMNSTAEFFQTLGVRPLYGRDFRPEEGTLGHNLVTILGHRFWERRFGGDTSILGRPIDLNGIPTTVIGIMGPDYAFPRHAELWVPIGIDPQSTNCWCYSMFGRLAPGATVEDAATEIASLLDAFFAEREPGVVRTERSRVVAVPIVRDLAGSVDEPLLLLLAAVGLVFLIACANIANLLLARGALRRQEMAIRCCLGATSPRILRQLVMESALLAAAGAMSGVALAVVGVRVLGAIVVERVPHVQSISLDGSALLFATGVAVLAGLLFGVAPAFRTARVDLVAGLKDGGRGSRGVQARRLNRGFVVAQFALSLVLLVGAALVLQSFRNVLAIDRGFDAENVLVARVSLPGRTYPDVPSVAAFQGRLLRRVQSLSGVRDAALSQTAPFTPGDNQQNVHIEGRDQRPGDPVRVASVRGVSPTYFRTIGTTILEGRAFDATDRPGGPAVVVIDASLARQYWPDGDAIGKQIRIGDPARPLATIVGVAQSVKHRDLVAPADHYVYLPLTQAPRWQTDIVVRTVGDPMALAADLRREVAQIDPRIPLYDVHTLDQAVADSLRTRRVTQQLLIAFAAAALLLATIGIYGVMSLGVGARTNEFGIRLALGARPGQVRRLVLGEGLRLIVAGVSVGLVGAATLTRGMGSLLYGVEPFDPAIFAAAALVMSVAAVVACYLPARRATETDPITALRAE